MISEKMKPLLGNNSAIRAMFEEGRKLAAEYGAENVYDFSLGNPNMPAPEAVRRAVMDIISGEESIKVHGYMNNAGYEEVRAAIAASLNKRFNTSYRADNLIMTVGAASALNILFRTVLNPEDEVIVFAPYFVEYGNYVRNYDGKLVVIPADTESFQPDTDALAEAINKRTKALIINTPNNPTGVVYSKETIERINEIISKREKALGIEIAVVSDEPYRELVYDGASAEWIPSIIPHSAVVYSYSKSLSLPGERIGWLLIPDSFPESKEVIQAAIIANRCTGSVNAPSLFQQVIARCLDESTDIDAYDRNRRRLYEGLLNLGFECIKPEGAFYLFVKSPLADESEFVKICKAHRILTVPGSAFACPGYVRLAYCVSFDMIERAMPAFEAAARECGLI